MECFDWKGLPHLHAFSRRLFVLYIVGVLFQNDEQIRNLSGVRFPNTEIAKVASIRTLDAILMMLPEVRKKNHEAHEYRQLHLPSILLRGLQWAKLARIYPFGFVR